MKKLFLLLLAALSSGCGALNAIFGKEHCGMEFVLQKTSNVSTAYKFINLTGETISTGMTTDQVIATWGKPDRVISPEEWIYFTERKSVDQYLRYRILFHNNIVDKIEEMYLKKEYQCRTNDL